MQQHSDFLLEKATRQHTKGHNNRLVLRTIYEYGEMSRADLARLTRLTRATVSEVAASLIDTGLIEEVGEGVVAIGRTPTLLSVVDDARYVAAISVTSEQVRGGLVNLRGVVRRELAWPLPSHDGAAVLATMFSLVDVLTQAADRPLLGIGVNTPGLVDTTTGTVVRAVTYGWADVPLRTLLQERSQLPVYVANDSHSLALAEYMFGPKQGSANLVVIKAGLGIGAGIVLGGHLYAGEGYGAGEIGHLVVQEHGDLCKCGNRGCLETVASSAVILRRAREVTEAKPGSILGRIAANPAAPTLTDIALAAEAGDHDAQQIIASTGRALAVAVASLVSVLNVRRIIITGRVAGLGEQLQAAVCEELAQRILPALVQTTEIKVLAMNPNAPLLGAAAPLLTYELGLERLVQRPTLADSAAKRATV